MKYFKVLIMVIIAGVLNSCSPGEENVQVMISSSAYQLIPAKAKSCYATRTEGDTPAPQDIGASYFKIPTIGFSRSNVDRDLVIATVRIKIPVPGSAGVDCIIGGDDLAALHDTWWANPGREAVIAAGTTGVFSTTCPIYCGGIERKGAFVASGTLEIFGLERTPNDISAPENPILITTPITIQSQF